MITLYGVALSPYYNKVKIALIEKGVNFREQPTAPAQTPEVLALSPMGKIPYVDINGHALAESCAILEWLEDAYPTAALLPPTPNSRAHARELALLLEHYVLTPANPLCNHVLFGSALPDAVRSAAAPAIERGLAAVMRRAVLTPWLAGEGFSHADISAAAVLPVVSSVCRDTLDCDPVLAVPELASYLEVLAQRPSVARTWQERDAAITAFLEARQAG